MTTATLTTRTRRLALTALFALAVFNAALGHLHPPYRALLVYPALMASPSVLKNTAFFESSRSRRGPGIGAGLPVQDHASGQQTADLAAHPGRRQRSLD